MGLCVVLLFYNNLSSILGGPRRGLLRPIGEGVDWRIDDVG